jgi:hypothetical protein
MQFTIAGIASKIGSTGFKWALKGILACVGTVLAAGIVYLSSRAASYNPDVTGAVADIGTLKKEYGMLRATADDHTVRLTQAEDDRKRSAEVQSKIFKAIEQISTDLHAVDVHVAAVGQQVTDQAEDIRELNQRQK